MAKPRALRSTAPGRPNRRTKPSECLGSYPAPMVKLARSSEYRDPGPSTEIAVAVPFHRRTVAVPVTGAMAVWKNASRASRAGWYHWP